MSKKQDDDIKPSIFGFEGFEEPESNYFRLPRTWTDITSHLNSVGEIKVVEYILKHTWGYREYGVLKHITIDELMKGRKYGKEKAIEMGRERMDDGTGLSHEGVRTGLQRAILDGLIEEAIDDSDKGRVKKLYTIKMRPPRESESDSRKSAMPSRKSAATSRNSDPSQQTSKPRTKKDTRERSEERDYRNDRDADELMAWVSQRLPDDA